MDSVSPVWTDADVEGERVIALDQPEYLPLIALPFTYSDGVRGVAVRFRLTDKEREAIAGGADLLVTELASSYFTPIHIQTCPPNTRPE